MIKTSTRMQKRREAGIHPQRTKGFTPVYREQHNILKDVMETEKQNKQAMGEDKKHPLARRADVLERGWMWVSYLVSRAIERNNKLKGVETA